MNGNGNGAFVPLGRLKVAVVREASEGFALGAIVIPRRGAARPNVYATLYEALRSRMTIMRRYGARNGRRGAAPAELDALASLRDTLGDAHVALAVGDVDGAPEALDGAAAALKGSRNAFKKDAKARAQAGVVRHSTSTVNRSATRARLSAIDRRLSAREDEVRSIAPWIGAMETALLLELRRSEGVVHDIDRTVNAIRRHELVRKGSTSDKQRAAIAARLRLLADPAATLFAAPFVQVRLGLAEPLMRASVAAGSGSASELACALGACALITGKSRARAVIESVLTLIAADAPSGTLLRATERAGKSAIKLAFDGGMSGEPLSKVSLHLRTAYRCVRAEKPDVAKNAFKEAISLL